MSGVVTEQLRALDEAVRGNVAAGSYRDALWQQDCKLQVLQRVHGPDHDDVVAAKCEVAEIVLLLFDSEMQQQGPADAEEVSNISQVQAASTSTTQRPTSRVGGSARASAISGTATRHGTKSHSPPQHSVSAFVSLFSGLSLDSTADLATKLLRGSQPLKRHDGIAESTSQASSNARAANTTSNNSRRSATPCSPTQEFSGASTVAQADGTLAATARKLVARLGVARATLLHRQGRSRAALPTMQRAIRTLEFTKHIAAERFGASVSGALSLATAYLSYGSMLSASDRHDKALWASHQALQTVLDLEGRCAARDPVAPSTSADSVSIPTHSGTIIESSATIPSPQTTVPGGTFYFGGFQVACFHNIGAEQEHLKLPELALESYQTGFELAAMVHGPKHALTQRLKQCYSELFASLNVRHFGNNSAATLLSKPSVTRQTASGTAEVTRALKFLEASYRSSSRHASAYAAESQKQEQLLRHMSMLHDNGDV